MALQGVGIDLAGPLSRTYSGSHMACLEVESADSERVDSAAFSLVLQVVPFAFNVR